MERRLGDLFCNSSGHFFHLCNGGRDGRGVACNDMPLPERPPCNISIAIGFPGVGVKGNHL